MNESSPLNGNYAFTMHGAREILEISAGAVHIEKTIIALERSVLDNPGLAFDLSKALIETICTTIFVDRGYSAPENQKLPPLVKKTIKELNLVPEDYDDNSPVKQSLQTIVNGLSTAIQGLCELRNLEGAASHGRDGYTKSLEPLQALFAARAADTIVSFLYKAHRSREKSFEIKRIFYGDLPDFDEYLDNTYGTVSIANSKYLYKTSEALYTLDEKAYLDSYTDYLNDLATTDEIDDIDTTKEDEEE